MICNLETEPKTPKGTEYAVFKKTVHAVPFAVFAVLTVPILHDGVIFRGESETFHVRIQVSGRRQPLD